MKTGRVRGCLRVALRSSALTVAAVAAAGVVLTGCGEKPQTANASEKKSDTRPYEGGQSVSMAPGWKAGDNASWEEQMRRRVQNQNEYIRVK